MESPAGGVFTTQAASGVAGAAQPQDITHTEVLPSRMGEVTSEVNDMDEIEALWCESGALHESEKSQPPKLKPVYLRHTNEKIGTIDIRAITPDNITPQLANEVLHKSLDHRIWDNIKIPLTDKEKQDLLIKAAEIYQSKTPEGIEMLWRQCGTFDMNQERNAVNQFDENGQLISFHEPDMPIQSVSTDKGASTGMGSHETETETETDTETAPKGIVFMSALLYNCPISFCTQGQCRA